MYLPVMSIVDGTWGSGEGPEEFATFLLMREMHWSWDQLQATPKYVQRFCFDFVQLIFEEENRRAEENRAV